MLRASQSTQPSDSWLRVLTERARSNASWLIRPEDPVRSDSASRLSYADLYAQATFLAGALVRRGLVPGDRTVVAFDNGSEFCLSYFAVVLAGGVPVPFPPPYVLPKLEIYRERLNDVVTHCEARWILTDRDTASAFGQCPAWPTEVVDYAELCRAPSLSPHRLPPPAAERELGLVQYTSGTTGAPRAIELTHGNVLHNVHGIVERIDPQHRDVALCWLPMFHDMGLIGSMLAATYSGVPIVMMTPREFVMRPQAWLWAMSRFQVSVCAAPNFAYKLCADRVQEDKLRGLNLTHWTAALTGAEHVDARVVEAFERRFSAFGLPVGVTMPVYGLAENTVACCFSERGAGATFDAISRESLQRGAAAEPAYASEAGVRRVAAVGTPVAGQAVRIWTALGEGRERELGEIQIAGPCVMRGYFRDPQRTAAAIGEDGWLRTGDLGYIAAGKLHVVGRASDVIKRAGRRYDAADVEAATRAISAARGRVAAFGVFNAGTGTDDLVVLVESELVPAEQPALQHAIRTAVYERLGVQPDVVRTVEPGSIPRTTSGKVNNQAARAAFSGDVPRAL